MRFLKKMKGEISLNVGEVGEEERCFHRTFKFVLVMGQFFGVMPLHGILSKDFESVKFKWKSLRVLYSFYNAIGALIASVFCILKFAVHGLEIDKSGTLIFYVSNCLGSLQFIQIARAWPIVLREWAQVEKSMKHYNVTPKLIKKFVFIAILIMGLAFIEHFLFILNAWFESKKCRQYQVDSAKTYFTVAFPHYFTLISYTPALAVLTESSNVLSTFTWNFTDLFIILICKSLTVQFHQIVEKCETTKVMQGRFWRDIREDYNKVSHLARTVDNHIAPLVLVSYFNNIFFLCIQLYNSLKERVGAVETLYFFYSFGFLVARTIAVSMYGAWLNEESKRPLETIYAVPSEDFCIEIKRLSEQIHSSAFGITGSKFFTVTRNFLLQMAGTIITVELMIFQFGPIKGYNSTTFNCD